MNLSIQHPTPETALFDVDGVTCRVVREEVRPGIKMLIMESAFYQRFGPGGEVLPQLRASFRALDQRLQESRAA